MILNLVLVVTRGSSHELNDRIFVVGEFDLLLIFQPGDTCSYASLPIEKPAAGDTSTTQGKSSRNWEEVVINQS